MGDLVFAVALFTLLEIPTDFGPVDVMIFTAPSPIVRLLNPPENRILTRELLEFAKTRPYSQSIPHWWDEEISTKEVAQEIQRLEFLIKSLPPLEDTYRFRNNESLYAELDLAKIFYKNLAESAAFMLEEEQIQVAQLLKHYNSYQYCYWQVINARQENNNHIYRREMLQSLKDTIGKDWYKKGMLPGLMPEIKKP